jgi:sec-independent protein translocase protein TatB
MFGIGVPEFFTVLILALIVLGPERLPVAMRTVGQWVRRLRETTREFRKEFAEEFSILYEEMDFMRKEAETTRQELLDIRAELTATVQGAADDVNEAGQGVMEDLRGTLDTADGSAPSRPNGAPTTNGTSDRPQEPLSASDVMALAIQETFAPNGHVAPATNLPSEPAGSSAPQPLTAYAPDMDGPVEPDAPVIEPSSDAPAIDTVPAAMGSQAPEVFGPPSPSLQNQLGGFVRLMAMQALETNPDFAEQAEAALRAQAAADADGLTELTDADPLDVAQAWAERRRHLVPHESVTVDQKAEESAVIELGTCPYGLTAGNDHPICSVSNTYDHEFFKRFHMKATYTFRMSEGASQCQLVVLTHARMRKYGVRFENDDLPDPEPLKAVADPAT